MSRYFARVVDGIVEQVIIAASLEWCQSNLAGTWVETVTPRSTQHGQRFTGPGREWSEPDSGWRYRFWDTDIDLPDIYLPDDAPPANVEAANHLADILETASGKTRPS